MDYKFTIEDIAVLLNALEYSRLNYESTQYPSYDLKREQLDKVDVVTEKLKFLQDQLKANS